MSKLHSYLRILPNSNDAWASSSPFSGYTLGTGETSFVLSTITQASVSTSKVIPGKLVSLGKLNKSANIFSSSSSFKGIGGVAKTADFSFELEALSGDIDFYALMGRSVELIIGFSDTIVDYDGVNNKRLFKGKIYEVDPSKNVFSITARGRFNLWNKEIGTVLEDNESSIYKAEIVPITYGIWTDDHAYLPIILNKDVANHPTLYLGKKKHKSLSNLVVWDPAGKRSIVASAGGDVTVSDTNVQVDLKSLTTNYLIETVAPTVFEVKIWNPKNFTVEVSDAFPLSEDLVGHTPTVRGSVYTDGTVKFEFLNNVDQYYIFTVPDAEQLPDLSGSLSKVSGYGPSILHYSWRGRFTESTIDVEQTIFESNTWPRRANKYEPAQVPAEFIHTASSALTSCTYFILDSETLQVYRRSVNAIANMYVYDTFYVLRGQLGSDAAPHTELTFAYLIGDRLITNAWLCKDTFPVTSLSNFASPELGAWYNITMAAHTTRKYPVINEYKNPIPYKVITVPDINGVEWGSVEIDLHFPKINLAGAVNNIFIKGLFSVSTDSENPVNYVYAAIGLGGLPTPFNFAFPDEGNVFYLGGGLGEVVIEDSNPIKKYHRVLHFLALSHQGTDKYSYYFNNSGKDLFDLYSKNTDTDYRLQVTDLVPARLGGKERDIDLSGSILNINDLNTSRYFINIFYQLDTLGKDKKVYLILAELGFLIYFYVDPLQTPFWGKGSGRVFDSSLTYFNGTGGALIENPVDVIEDLARSELSLTNNELDETSFDAAHTARAGWKSTFSIYKKPMKWFDLLNWICPQQGLLVSENNDGKITVDSLSIPENTTGLRELTDSEILTEDGSPAYREGFTSVDNIFTQLDVAYQKNEPDDSFAQLFSIDNTDYYMAYAKNILDEDVKVTFNLDTIRSTNPAQYITELVKKYYYRNLRILTIKVALSAYDIRVGQWITLENSSYLPNVTNNVYLCIGYDLQVPYRDTPPSFTLTLLELQTGESTSDEYINFVYNDPKEIDYKSSATPNTTFEY